MTESATPALPSRFGRWERKLVDMAASRYAVRDLSAVGAAWGKLRTDLVFIDLLRHGRLSHVSHILDLGCGRGLLFAVVLAAQSLYRTGQWPANWPLPPLNARLSGIDYSPSSARLAQRALGTGVSINQGDLTASDIPSADCIALIDVLHYLPLSAQSELLNRIAQALAPGGLLLLRVGNRGSGWRHALTRVVDQCIWALRGHRGETAQTRSTEEWMSLLQAVGFRIETSVAYGGLVANVLFVARR